MEKLLNLLNEYEYFKELKEVPEEEKDLFVQKNFWHESYGVLNSYGCEDYEILKRKFCNMYAISKEYGFIKWLVDEDKIDKDNEELVSLMSELGEFEQYEKCLLMLLAIGDSPIDDLILYLK